jgi:4-aminobutyrate aminotransferase-like enzyme
VSATVTRRVVEARSLNPALLAHGAIEVARAEGCWMYDQHGRRYFDASAGSGAVNLGHGYMPVVRACVAQLEALVHVGWNHANSARTQLCETLPALLPFPEAAILFTVTGAEAIEAAIKVTRAATGREWLIAFTHAYHGKTAGALSVTWSPSFRRFGALPADAVEFAPFPDQSATTASGVDDERCLDALRRLLRSRPTPPAAVIVEPVQGAEGIYPASDTFLAGVIAAAHEAGALVIYDEIYTGFGRCGWPFIASRPGLLPDLIAIGKALGNGMPISAVVGPPEILDALPSGAHSSTFAGHPVSCAAAIAVVEAMRTLRPWESSRRVGAHLRSELCRLGKDVPCIGPPRGDGLMLAFDCLDDAGKPDAGLARRFLDALLTKQLIARGGGSTGATVKLTPPLLMEDAEVAFLIDAIQRAGRQVIG